MQLKAFIPSIQIGFNFHLYRSSDSCTEFKQRKKNGYGSDWRRQWTYEERLIEIGCRLSPRIFIYNRKHLIQKRRKAWRDTTHCVSMFSNTNYKEMIHVMAVNSTFFAAIFKSTIRPNYRVKYIWNIRSRCEIFLEPDLWVHWAALLMSTLFWDSELIHWSVAKWEKSISCCIVMMKETIAVA